MDLIAHPHDGSIVQWPHGRVLRTRGDVASVAATIDGWVKESSAEAVLVWDATLGAPPEADLLHRLLGSSADVWHAGLRLGLSGLPALMDTVRPTWMLHTDPNPSLEATSWRVSLRACLMRREVLRRLVGIRTCFDTLDGAGLEFGHRCIVRGAILRHIPALVAGTAEAPSGRWHRPRRERWSDRLFGLLRLAPAQATERPDQQNSPSDAPSPLTLRDEFTFLQLRFGPRWLAWALIRAIALGYAPLTDLLGAWNRVRSMVRPPEVESFRGQGSLGLGDVCEGQTTVAAGALPESTTMAGVEAGQGRLPPGPVVRVPNADDRGSPPRAVSSPVTMDKGGIVEPDRDAANCRPRVTVLIPTVDRYPYLRTLLDQLRRQTIRPSQIVVVDQTRRDRRQEALAEEFADLPLQVLYQDEPGQCSSRNAGLAQATGDFVLFLDDDDEVGSDLIERHVDTLRRWGAEVCAGVAHEVGAGALPVDFRRFRVSDVFPTNNSLIQRTVLERSGLFDLAYNRGQRADGDLGTRLYLSGALMVIDPGNSVLHHHAPSGGLRLHKARTITYASSRRSLTQRQLLTPTDIYLGMRYSGVARVREALWQNLLGTLSCHGGVGRRVAKVVLSGLLLPHSIWVLRQRIALAGTMLRKYPQIPGLPRTGATSAYSEAPKDGTHEVVPAPAGVHAP